MTQVALLRGINVGGKNKLPMKDLAAIFAEIGCAGVKTYIQSGNVIFKAPSDVTAKLAARASSLIQERFGFRIPVLVRSTAEMGETIAKNPFLESGKALETLHVLFLAGVPDAAAVGKLDPGRSHPDAFVVVNRDVYLHLPNGAADTKLTNAYFDSRLSTVSTGRNWRTVLNLFGLMQEF